MCAFTTSQWGLISDIIGVLLLFRFGLPSKIESENGPGWATGAESDELTKIKNRNLRIKIGAYAGLFFILLGFVLQFLGASR